MTAPYFLIALQLEGRRALVVGSDDEALRRVRELLEHGAEVTLVTPAPSPSLEQLTTSEPRLRLLRAEPHLDHLEGVSLCVVADLREDWVELLGPACARRHLPFCAVDQPRHNSFAHVGVARAGALRVGVSTSGTAPALARWLRARLQELFDAAGFATVVERMAQARAAAPRELRREALEQELAKVRWHASIRVDDAPERTDEPEP